MFSWYEAVGHDFAISDMRIAAMTGSAVMTVAVDMAGTDMMTAAGATGVFPGSTSVMPVHVLSDLCDWLCIRPSSPKRSPPRRGRSYSRSPPRRDRSPPPRRDRSPPPRDDRDRSPPPRRNRSPDDRDRSPSPPR